MKNDEGKDVALVEKSEDIDFAGTSKNDNVNGSKKTAYMRKRKLKREQI